MRFRLRSPRQLADKLLTAARREPEDVALYLLANRKEWEALAEEYPSDAADVLEQLDHGDAAILLAELQHETTAEVLEEIAPELAAELIIDVPLHELAKAVDEMPDEAAADLIGELDDELAEDLFSAMSDPAEQGVRDLLEYPPDSAGGLMTTNVAALPIGLTTGEAIERLRQLHDQWEDLSYVYVVDEQDRLEGVISFRHLVFHRPGAPLADVMVEALAVGPRTDREEVAELCQRYHWFGVPVVSDDGVLLGMVPTDSVIEAIQDEATEDFAAAVGAAAEETVYSAIGVSVKGRAPWLILNLFLALLVAFVIEAQTEIISREPILAALMPVIALLGGNGGSQSLAVMIRSLASNDVPGAQVPAILARQAWVGTINGVLLAVISGASTWVLVAIGVFQSDAGATLMSFVVAVATLASLLISGIAGAWIPLVLRRMGQDPAVAASIFLTLIADIVGFGGFLLVAARLV